MKYRYLGESGLAVSTVALGTMTFGEKRWGTDADQSTEILNAYFALGGNFIDTADKYNDGQSEKIIGRWLSGQNRNEVVVATKCYYATGNNINSKGLSRKHIINACESSLRRLNTDHIDLYQVHEPDPHTPIEETLHALDLLLTQGKIRYIGCCNFPSWQLIDAFHSAKQQTVPPFISGQYLYNLLKRDIESEIVPAAERCKTGILCWSPLSGGMLTGKHTDPKRPLDGSRLALRDEFSATRYSQWYIQSAPIIEKLTSIAKSHHTSNVIIALAWALMKRQVTSVIIGARTKEQILMNCESSGWELPMENLKELDQISQPPLPYPASLIRDHAAEPE